MSLTEESKQHDPGVGTGNKRRGKKKDKDRWRNVAVWIIPVLFSVALALCFSSHHAVTVWASVAAGIIAFGYVLFLLEWYILLDARSRALARLVFCAICGLWLGLGMFWQTQISLPVLPIASSSPSPSPSRPPAGSVGDAGSAGDAGSSGREFLDIDVEKLLSFFEKYNEAQAESLVQPYIGKWLEISGSVGEVSRDLLPLREGTRGVQYGIKVQLDTRRTGKPKHSVVTYALFEEQRWMTRALVLKRDESVKVRGRIKSIYSFGFFLEHCELIE